jgi:hypothetical protein
VLDNELESVLLLAFYLLPESFKAGLIARNDSAPRTFSEVMKPYFPYFLYMFSLWMGIVFPVFICFIRNLSLDRQWHREAGIRLSEVCQNVSLSSADTTSKVFEDLELAFQNYK